jgi:hypothetical protein
MNRSMARASCDEAWVVVRVELEELVLLDAVVRLEDDDDDEDVDWLGWVEPVVGCEDVVADGVGAPPELAR